VVEEEEIFVADSEAAIVLVVVTAEAGAVTEGTGIVTEVDIVADHLEAAEGATAVVVEATVTAATDRVRDTMTTAVMVHRLGTKDLPKKSSLAPLTNLRVLMPN